MNDPIKSLVNNAWKWGLYEFAQATGLDPNAESTQKAFRNFQNAAEAIRQLDNRVLGIVTGAKDNTPTVAV